MARLTKFLMAVSLPLALVTSTVQAADVDRIEVGVLECAVKGGGGFVFQSTKDLSCRFKPADGARSDEPYFGAISKFGIDIGTTDNGVISWAVLAPTTDIREPGALAGTYRGVSAQTTVGVGLGANVLLGGSGETIALQPLSVSTQTGLNFALAIGQVELRSIVD
ncbi:DUF992 domain-containing protein [Cohaesibacter celericrescens]|nr:DUF992 domain-containing protein [Cohaesibacter celericrescens]